jgi:hypothetical protein
MCLIKFHACGGKIIAHHAGIVIRKAAVVYFPLQGHMKSGAWQ